MLIVIRLFLDRNITIAMYRLIGLLALLFIANLFTVHAESRQCQLITYYQCKNIGYNQTYLPNRFNHQDQKDVALVVSNCASLS
jgi:hypothetical protein